MYDEILEKVKIGNMRWNRNTSVAEIRLDDGRIVFVTRHELMKIRPLTRQELMETECPECRGTGYVQLFTSTQPCSRGCKK